MQLLKLTLRLPRCLTAVDGEGDLPCTLVRIAASTLTRTAGAMLASAIEEAAAAERLRATIHGEEDEPSGDGDDSEDGGGGVFVLPLAPAFEHEPVSQLFVYGQLPDPDAIPAAAKACGLELALTDEGAISSFNEGHLHDIGLRLLQQHLARKGYIRVFDHVYVPARQLFGEKASAPGSVGSAAATAPRFLEGIKLLPLLDTRTTEPFAGQEGGGGGGVLGLSISFEPQVYKWVPVDWAAVQAFAARRRQDRKEQRRLVRKGRGEEGPQCSQEEEGEEADGLDPFPDSEAALALLAVKAIPGLTGHGFIASLPTPTPNPTGLLRANQRHGFDLHIPTTEAAMRRFWQHTYQIELPAGPIRFCRVRFKGQDFGRAFTYPAPCLAQEVALSYARTTQAYTRLSRAALDLLGAMPGCLQAVYHSSSSTTANDPSKTTTTTTTGPVARPSAPTATAMLALTPLKAGRAHVAADERSAASGGLALTSARQLRDQARAQGGEDGARGGVVLLLPTATGAGGGSGGGGGGEALIPSTEEKGRDGSSTKAPPTGPSRPPASTITTGRTAAAAAAAAAAGTAGLAAPRTGGKQPRVLSLFEDDDELVDGGLGMEEEGHRGEGEAGPPLVPPKAAAAKPSGPSASALMPPPAAPAKPKPKAGARKGKRTTGAGNGGGGKRKAAGDGGGGAGAAAAAGKKKGKAKTAAAT